MGTCSNGYWSLSQRYSSQCSREAVFFGGGGAPVDTWVTSCLKCVTEGFLREKNTVCLMHFLVFFCVFFYFRHDKNKRRAEEVSEKLRDNRDLQHFLQNTQDVSSLSVYSLFGHWETSISTLIISLIIPSLALDITVFSSFYLVIIWVNLPSTSCCAYSNAVLLPVLMFRIEVPFY